MNLSIYAINYTKEGMSQVYDTPPMKLYAKRDKTEKQH